jgi:hypothetical protein
MDFNHPSSTAAALRASEAAQASFLEAIKTMEAGRRPVDVERLLGLAHVVLQAHEAFRATWATEGSFKDAH